MRGVIHRCMVEKGPDHFGTFVAASSQQKLNTRSASIRDGRQIAAIRNKHFLKIERRSALGLIWVYNRIPDEIVSHDGVKDFKQRLQVLFKEL